MDEFIWITYAGSIALVVFLYGAKSLALCNPKAPQFAVTFFVFAVAACVPMIWALSPDWDNPNVFPIAVYVGSPVATLSVPVVSFFIDWTGRVDTTPANRLIRYLIEWFVAVPLWSVAWIFFEFYVLGWIWI